MFNFKGLTAVPSNLVTVGSGEDGIGLTHINRNFMLCHVMLRNVMSCYIMLCQVMLRYVMSCYVMLCYVMLCQVMLRYVMSCYVMLYHVMLRYVMSCYVMLCHVMLRYVILCVQQVPRLTPVKTREDPNIKGCCNKGFNNLMRNYTFHLFREKFSAGQRLFNETEFMCAITSRYEREYNLSLNLLVAMERKTKYSYTMLYL